MLTRKTRGCIKRLRTRIGVEGKDDTRGQDGEQGSPEGTIYTVDEIGAETRQCRDAVHTRRGSGKEEARNREGKGEGQAWGRGTASKVGDESEKGCGAVTGREG